MIKNIKEQIGEAITVINEVQELSKRSMAWRLSLLVNISLIILFTHSGFVQYLSYKSKQVSDYNINSVNILQLKQSYSISKNKLELCIDSKNEKHINHAVYCDDAKSKYLNVLPKGYPSPIDKLNNDYFELMLIDINALLSTLQDDYFLLEHPNKHKSYLEVATSKTAYFTIVILIFMVVLLVYGNKHRHNISINIQGEPKNFKDIDL